MLYLQQSLGIDFREDTLRVVLLGRAFNRVVLVDYLIKRYPTVTDKAREGDVVGEMVADLKSFLARNTRPPEVILGLPRDKVILREVNLPILAPEELKELISYEIERHIPLPSQEVYYDYKIMGKVSESKQKIILGLIRKEDLDFYLMIMERADLIPTLATPVTFALQDCPACEDLDDRTLGLLVDFGEREFELDLVRGNKVLFSRSIPVKEGRLDDDFIMDQGTRTEEPAATDEAPSPIDMQTRTLGSGLLTTVGQWLRATDPPLTDPLKRVILTGINTYDYPYLADYFHEQAGIEVLIPNPFQGLTDKKIPGRIASALALATGLSAKGLKERFIDVNLLPPEMRVRKKSHAFGMALILISLLFLLLTSTVYTGFGKDNRFYLPKRMKLNKVLTASQDLQDQVQEVKDLTLRIEQVSQETRKIQDLMNSRVSKLEILKELSVLIPEDAWLDRITIANDGIEINGYADSSSILIGTLEDSPLFENVIFPSTITKRGGEKERFRIKADIQKGLSE
ncbi:MAG: PilN domain-containing protein [bacterium]